MTSIATRSSVKSSGVKSDRQDRERKAIEKAADLFKEMYGPAIRELEAE